MGEIEDVVRALHGTLKPPGEDPRTVDEFKDVHVGQLFEVITDESDFARGTIVALEFIAPITRQRGSFALPDGSCAFRYLRPEWVRLCSS